MASPVNTSVKFFNEGMPGAPVLNGVAGSLIAVLDACLVTGFGARTAVSAVVSSGVATVTLSSDAKNAALQGAVVLVEGVTGTLTALNGEQRVTSASDVFLKFATASADGTATGTITVKTAPAGWTKAFSGTNKAAYTSLAAESLGAHLWVNDTLAATANVRGYETMSGVDTGSGPFPTAADVAGGLGGFWSKSVGANANVNKWDLFADSRLFYWCPMSGSGNTTTATGQGGYWFGDILPYKSGDAFAASISAARAAPGGAAGNGNIFTGTQNHANGAGYFPRSYGGLGASVLAYAMPICGAQISFFSGEDNTMGLFPAPTDGGLRLSKMFSTEAGYNSVTTVLRGEMPGAYYCPQSGLRNAFQRGDTVVLSGKVFRAVQSGTNFSDTVTTNAGRGFFDVTGPWR